jgi:threonine synthase
VKFMSTRGKCPQVSASEALLAGLAPDGGLYLPESLPRLGAKALEPSTPYAERALALLEPFFAGDRLEAALPALCEDAFSFPVPLVPLAGLKAGPDAYRAGYGAGAGGATSGAADGTKGGGRAAPLRVLELFHGPTAAFKDFGARFLARCMETLERGGAGAARSGAEGPLTILVATSGDTGGAVAAAFHRRPGLAVRVLFPEFGVSDRQRRQLCCWDDNVRSYALRGSFDDCQRLVKAAFRDPELSARQRLSSANSINLGRLLPQAVYHAHAAILFKEETGYEPLLVVPSGNLGDAMGAYWARAMGAPIGRIVMAVNANRALPDFLASGDYRPRPSVATIANAMDVGDPSNLERLRAFYPDLAELKREAAAHSVSDDEIRLTIKRYWDEAGYLFCPHSASAAYARAAFYPDEPAILVATAHPAKFDTVVEPLIGASVPVPPSLRALLDAPSSCDTIDPELAQLFPR